MKTTYDELKDRASKGPFVAIIPSNGAVQIMDKDCTLGDVCDLYHKNGSRIVTKEKAEANAKLIEHCLNNFDALLEFAKYASEELPSIKPRHENLAKHTEIVEWGKHVVKAAKEISQ